MIDDLYQLHVNLQNKGVLFVFNGPISQEVIENVGDTLTQELAENETGVGPIRRIFCALVEQMKNVVGHSQELVAQPESLNGDLRIGTLVVGKDEGCYWVACGNLVKTEQTPGLRNRLDFIRSLNREQLETLYREHLKNTSDLKGAGLGLIEIARKASRPLEYSFISAGQGMAFFTIKAVIQCQKSK